MVHMRKRVVGVAGSTIQKRTVTGPAVIYEIGFFESDIWFQRHMKKGCIECPQLV